MARIYVSSTFMDLKECREKVRLSLRQMGHEDVAMEYYVAEDKRPLDKRLEDVASSDLYIGIFAWRYGYVPAGQDKSITELEYRKAAETDKKCLIFLLREDAPWAPMFVDRGKDAEKVIALRDELSKKHMVSFFKSADEFVGFVGPAVYKWNSESKIDATSTATSAMTSAADCFNAGLFTILSVVLKLATPGYEVFKAKSIESLEKLGFTNKAISAFSLFENNKQADKIRAALRNEFPQLIEKRLGYMGKVYYEVGFECGILYLALMENQEKNHC